MKRISWFFTVISLFFLFLAPVMATPPPEVEGEEEALPFLEFQLSPVATFAGGDISSFGYGLQAAIFPGEDIGLQLDYTFFSETDIDSATCSIVRRHIGSVLEPYAFAGGGFLASKETETTWHAGVGLGYWVTASISLFAEARYTWVNASADHPDHLGDYPSIAMGCRWSF